MNVIGKVKNYGLAGFVALSTSSAFAAGAIDTATSAITSSVDEAKIVGYAVMGALASVFVFKLIRRVL